MSDLMAFIRASHWQLHRPVLEQGVALIRRRLELGEPAGASDLETAAALRESRESRRRMQWDISGYGAVSDTEMERGYFVRGNTAVVPVQGLICKYAGMINGWSQPQGMTSARIAEVIDMASGDRAPNLVIDIDSPGGTVAGSSDITAAIERAQDRGKRVIAFAHDLCCSGGYRMAVACEEIYAIADAEAGSIGVYSVVEDSSAWFEKAGYTRYLIASGPHKGGGADGTKVTKDHIEAQLAVVKQMHGVFMAEVAAGRDMDLDEVEAVATGRTWIGQELVEVGLADGVMGFAELLDRLDKGD